MQHSRTFCIFVSSTFSNLVRGIPAILAQAGYVFVKSTDSYSK
jgi:hypothetical protein